MSTFLKKIWRIINKQHLGTKSERFFPGTRIDWGCDRDYSYSGNRYALCNGPNWSAQVGSCKSKSFFLFYFIYFFGGHKSFFMVALIPLFRTSGDVSSEFQSQSGQPYSSLAEVYVLHIP